MKVASELVAEKFSEKKGKKKKKKNHHASTTPTSSYNYAHYNDNRDHLAAISCG